VYAKEDRIFSAASLWTTWWQRSPCMAQMDPKNWQNPLDLEVTLTIFEFGISFRSTYTYAKYHVCSVLYSNSYRDDEVRKMALVFATLTQMLSFCPLTKACHPTECERQLLCSFKITDRSLSTHIQQVAQLWQRDRTSRALLRLANC